ncbi:hypothetical protein SISNIDRAFT_490884 [Sistotremastrum niveocremeum HHB9708]|uniref:Uncharacterized protein n=1 Tax=Sistotremastrum niveocremeum HHB9708 TaxID=1314777 RepID=A0A164NF30_9AGAM|nr:hypothetical protein SISNIDRAFT_490884 [Sistotremastrum niveocremeum HHB9708]
MPATVPAGTFLYHGRDAKTIPTSAEWLALDPEHSYLLGSWEMTAWMLTYVSEKPISVGYFDGNSAAKLWDGPLDVQDLLIWGVAEKDNVYRECDRINDLCAWGAKFGLDGFIRMESSFELMLCDFTKNVKLISHAEIMPVDTSITTFPPGPIPGQVGPNPFSVNRVNGTLADARVSSSSMCTFPLKGSSHSQGGFPRLGDPPSANLLLSPDQSSPQRPLTPQPNSTSPERPIQSDVPWPPEKPPRLPGPWDPPAGWRGSLRKWTSVSMEAMLAGMWHNFIPESRIQVDVSGYVTLFDPKYTSLVDPRRNQTRFTMRAANACSNDVIAFRKDVEEMLVTPQNASGVDWLSITQVLIERFSDRLDHLNFTLAKVENPAIDNATIAANVRNQVLVALMPYMLIDAIPPPSSSPAWLNISWAEPIYQQCSSAFMPSLPEDRLTPSERLIQRSIQDVNSEICRVLTLMWTEAFEIESRDRHSVNDVLGRWRIEIHGVMEWLGWAVWIRCRPSCKEGTVCGIPVWSIQFAHPGIDLIPRCINLDDPWNAVLD